MQDAVGGIREMARVTKPGGAVAASVWDLAGDRAPPSPFWLAAKRLKPGAENEAALTGARQGQLAEVFEAAGLRDVETAEHESSVRYETFDEWWQPYTFGVGPAGVYAVGLPDDERERLREECSRVLPEPPFTFTATAWSVRGVV
jgi:hypothetical protein